MAVVLVLSGVLAARTQRPGRPQDRGRPDERVGRIAGVVADLERRTDEFQTALRRTMGRSDLRGRGREDQLNRDAAQLARAMDRLRESWNGDHDPARSRKNAATAISAGRSINRTLARHRLRESIQREWNAVRDELNRLAEAFNEPKIRW
jgi:HAMP domain-containing protein